MKLHWVDILTLSIYLLAVLGIGIYFSRKTKTTEDYFVGGRSYKGWVIGLAMVGTSISSITFLAYPADAFKTAWLRFLPNLALPIGVILAMYFFLPFYRRKKTISAYEYLEDRFSPSIRVYGAVTFIIGQCVRLALILFLVSLLMYEITGLGAVESILLMGVVVSLYTVMGGIEAVLWTDVMQTITLIFGGLFILAVIVIDLPGGFGQIIEIANANNKFAVAELSNGTLQHVPWKLTLSDKSGLMMLLVGLTVWLQEFGTNQNVIQKYAAAKSMKEARKGLVTIGIMNIPIWALFMFIGTALYAFFQVFPTPEAHAMLTGQKKAEGIMPYFILNYLPVGIPGIVLSAVLAAAMSSLDSSINSISTVGVNDIYRRHFVKNREDKHYLNVAWIIASVTSVIMILGAIILVETETKTLQDAITILNSVVMGGVFGMYLLGFTTTRVNAKSIWVGICVTFIFSVWVILSERDFVPGSLIIPFDLYYTGMVGHILLFVTALFASFFIFRKKDKNDLTNLTIWTKDGTPNEK